MRGIKMDWETIEKNNNIFVDWISEFIVVSFYIFNFNTHLIQLQMEANINLLPKRTTKTTFKNADRAEFYTNYYDIQLDEKNSSIYQYVIQCHIPNDSTELLYKLTRSIKTQLKHRIGLVSFRGLMLWGLKSNPLPFNLIAKVDLNQKQMTYQLQFKQTKQLNLIELLKSKPEHSARAIQILNIINKQRLRSLQMVDLGMGKFYFKHQIGKNQVLKAGLTVWRGFKFSISMINSNPLIQIDICSRVLRSNTFFETIQGLKEQQILQEYKGATVMTKYGNNRTYKIQDIHFNESPCSKFYHNKQAAKITYQQYYADNYGLTLHHKKQPLIYTISKIEKVIKNQKIQQKIQYCYLIPQFVCLTGMSNEQRSNNQIMKNVSQYTKLSVEERVKLEEDIKGKLNKDKNNIFKIGNAKKVNGFILDQPNIITAQKNIKRAKDGKIIIQDRIKDPANFNDWIIVYSAGNKQKQDDKEADYAAQTLNKAKELFEISSKQPGFIVIKGNRVQNWKFEIQNDAKKNGKPQIIVLFVNRNQEKFYGELKRFITNQIQVPCQFIRRITLSQRNKNILSCASKIILQMNAKIGKAIWSIKSQATYLKNKKVMYGGLSISKGKGGYTLAFVGSTNNTFSNIYSACKEGIKRKEEIPSAILEDIFIQWAKTYYINNKSVPDVILLYREGLSDAQIRKQLDVEVNSLKAMIEKISTKVKLRQYKPQVLIITTNKKINSRFYAPLYNNNGKGIAKLSNPISGSVVLQQMSNDGSYDFHMVPQLVTQGTCTPTLYKIVYDDSNIPQQGIVEFTFQQCFNYPNWQGAIRVPSCLQSADKLSKLVGQHIKQSIKASDIQTKSYFL